MKQNPKFYDKETWILLKRFKDETAYRKVLAELWKWNIPTEYRKVGEFWEIFVSKEKLDEHRRKEGEEGEDLADYIISEKLVRDTSKIQTLQDYYEPLRKDNDNFYIRIDGDWCRVLVAYNNGDIVINRKRNNRRGKVKHVTIDRWGFLNVFFAYYTDGTYDSFNFSWFEKQNNLPVNVSMQSSAPTGYEYKRFNNQFYKYDYGTGKWGLLKFDYAIGDIVKGMTNDRYETGQVQEMTICNEKIAYMRIFYESHTSQTYNYTKREIVGEEGKKVEMPNIIKESKPNPQLLTIKSYFVHPDGRIIDCGKTYHDYYIIGISDERKTMNKFTKLTGITEEKYRKLIGRKPSAELSTSPYTPTELKSHRVIEELHKLGWFSIFTTGQAEMAIRGVNITPAKLEKLELVLLKHDLISDEVRISDVKNHQNAYFYTRKVKGFADAWRRRIKLNPQSLIVYRIGEPEDWNNRFFVTTKQSLWGWRKEEGFEKDVYTIETTRLYIPQILKSFTSFEELEEKIKDGRISDNDLKRIYPEETGITHLEQYEVDPKDIVSCKIDVERYITKKKSLIEGDNMLKKKRKNPFKVGTTEWGQMDDASKKGDAGAFVDVEIRPAIEAIDVDEFKTEHPGKNSLCVTVNQLLTLAFDKLEDAEPIEGDPTHFMYKGTKLSKNTVHHKVIKMLESQGFSKLGGKKGIYCMKV